MVEPGTDNAVCDCVVNCEKCHSDVMNVDK